MHKDDQMTPKERLAGFFSNKPIDRIPILPFVTSVSGKVAGMTHKEKRSCAKNQAKAQIACYERFGNDSISIEYGLHGIGIALGSKTNDPEDGVPAIIDHYLKNLKDLNCLDLSKVERKNDPWNQLNYDAYNICMDECGDEVGASLSIHGPITAEGSIYPVEKLLRSTRKEPQRVHELLRFSTDAIKIVMKDFLEIGAGISLCDPMASGTLIDRKTYREFVLPYTKEIVDYVHSFGKSLTYHVCGDTSHMTLDLVESGCNMLSIDNRVSLKETKKLVGDKLPIVGNVDPVEVMMLGSIEDVYKAVRCCIEDAYDSPKGYLLSTGCGIPINSPIENIDALMDAGRKYGKWPININNFDEEEKIIKSTVK